MKTQKRRVAQLPLPSALSLSLSLPPSLSLSLPLSLISYSDRDVATGMCGCVECLF
jgi:hypothetical protein